MLWCFCLQVTLYHLLKLFQSDSSAMPKKTVVSEFYDEMVRIQSRQHNMTVLIQSILKPVFLQIFQDPTAMMQQLLNTTRQLTLGPYKHETECECFAYLHSTCENTVNQTAYFIDTRVTAVLIMQTNHPVAELELRTREKVEVAKKKMSLEIAELKERLKASRENINILKGEIRRLEEEDQMKDH